MGDYLSQEDNDRENKDQHYRQGQGDDGVIQAFATLYRSRAIRGALIVASFIGGGSWVATEKIKSTYPNDVEAKVQVLETDVSGLKVELRTFKKEMKLESRELRLDQIDQWRWDIESSPDHDTGQKANRLRELREKERQLRREMALELEP